uniref:Putative triosephosphate isomerase, Aldolase-type TIM barrel n=1 Tax=Helianthus annuus TaxID=4232 RepID=A0A251VFJ9_HELAN
MHSPFRSSLSPETRRPQLQPPPPFATTTTARNNHHRFVNGSNCKELGGLRNVDGFIVGGASLKSKLRDMPSEVLEEEGWALVYDKSE